MKHKIGSLVTSFFMRRTGVIFVITGIITFEKHALVRGDHEDLYTDIFVI
jgi:hypothetical protein